MTKKKEEIQKCGIVMPISSIDGCSESHWADVKEIITESIEDIGHEARLVSEADDAGVIHKRIIQNLYNNPIVVCDVSGKNPNVMFELGMRLAFDKPTIIIKDDETPYSFDTSAIEHIEYPRDLRFTRIVEFKQKLSKKIKATVKAAENTKNYTTFLKHFGEFKVAEIETKEVSADELIIDEIKSLKKEIQRERWRSDRREFERKNYNLEKKMIFEDDRKNSDLNICLRKFSEGEKEQILDLAKCHKDLNNCRVGSIGGHEHLFADVQNGKNSRVIKQEILSKITSLTE